MCMDCGIYYTIEPKNHEYSEETKQLATKMFFFGVSGRGVGKVLGMNKSNPSHGKFWCLVPIWRLFTKRSQSVISR